MQTFNAVRVNRGWWGKARLKVVMSIARFLSVPIDVHGSYFHRPASASPAAYPDPCQNTGLV